MNCINCSCETQNPKFCSKSCSTSYNNKVKPKRLRTTKCKKCENITHSYRHTLCTDHWNNYKENQWKGKTIGEYRNRESVKDKHGSWKHSHIRGLARNWLKHLTKEPCRFCGYDKHVELAHIKALSEFDDNALLSEVNSEENVIPLCPNCHWEFDNLPRVS